MSVCWTLCFYRQSLLACSDGVLLRTVCSYLNVLGGWEWAATVRGAVCGADSRQGSIGEVLSWEFKPVTTPDLADPGVSRPDEMVKNTAMLLC